VSREEQRVIGKNRKIVKKKGKNDKKEE